MQQEQEKPIISPITVQKPIDKKEEIVINKSHIKQNVEDIQKEEVKSTINYAIIASEGEEYEISDSDLVNLMVTGNKQLKRELMELWPALNNFIDSDEQPYAMLLKEGTPCIVNEKFVVLVYDFKSPTIKINIKQNQKGFVKILKKITGNSYHIYALDRSRFTSAYKNYVNLQQVNKLPKAIDIDLEK